MFGWLVFVLVLFAFLTAVLGYGLERQRRELAGLRREMEDWVAMDLKLKRQRLGLGLQSHFDPKGWVTRLVGIDVERLEADVTGHGFWAQGKEGIFFITPLGPKALRQRLRGGRSRLQEPVVQGHLPQILKAREVRRIGLAEDVLLDLAYAETARRLGLPREEPHQVYIYALPGER